MRGKPTMTPLGDGTSIGSRGRGPIEKGAEKMLKNLLAWAGKWYPLGAEITRIWSSTVVAPKLLNRPPDSTYRCDLSNPSAHGRGAF